MKKVFLLLFVSLMFGFIGALSWSSPAHAFFYFFKFKQCSRDLDVCNADLDMCFEDLEACEAEGGQIFPGDGQLGDPLGFGLPDHGPALSYTDNLDGTVTDDNTGFMWEMKTGSLGTNVSCTSAAVCPDPHNVNNLYTWTDTGDADNTDPDGTLFTVFIPQLNDACDADPTVACNDDADCAGVGGPCGFAGHRDWCVPNIKRLQSIVDYAVFSPSIDPTFGATKSSFYWSSTTVAFNTFDAWNVGFSSGLVDANIKTDGRFARAVRPCS
jgi:hypothetical protein